ncbi:MAG TPA: hypothetical protein VN688_08085 [Gemmataceae bacterium]|nr:hypothetical protein [Gemmataceae bacterium]
MQPRHHNTRRLPLILGVLLLVGDMAEASDWPRFRSPNSAGIAADKNVPVKWMADNILWKTPIPGIGHSSPIVHAGRIYLQSSSTNGKERWLLSLDAVKGGLVWKTPAQPARALRTHCRSR